MISQIACMAQNRVIGKNGDLPWDLPEDMKFFREKTKGHAIIMGRKTFEAMPGGKLPKRLNVVVTRQKGYKAEGCEVFSDIESAIEFCKTQTDQWGEEIFVIGGGEIYKQALPFTDRIYLTVIHKDFDGDAHFPDFATMDFEATEKKDREEPFPFSFMTYDRVICKKPMS